ncbi:hypothetical protein [Aquimarina sp. Aq78]|uniref:hypothetical protein n=1 Tax=Aquimarina sp. Aq78 TaxID=1191889 RepID=UPI000D0EBED7|nr:hypothetical protein [Aquimarina sp. Aq78]
MKKLILILICITSLSYGQIENRWQPDSVYSNRQVKKIFVYLNSSKDLSEIVEFNQTGKRISSIKYSASYNRKTRKVKRINKINLYQYNSSNHLVRIKDSLGNDSITFKYGTNGKLDSSIKKIGNLIYETKYYYKPFKSTTTRRNDSIILYQKTKEYDKDVYVKRFVGYYLEPKLKKVTDTINGIPNTIAYKDQNDLQKFADDKTITNTFDEEGRLIKSDIYSVFMNDRINKYELNYKYFKNGLLKSVRGYIPRYFKYEYLE